MKIKFFIPVFMFGDSEGNQTVLGDYIFYSLSDLCLAEPNAVGHVEMTGQVTVPIKSGAV